MQITHEKKMPYYLAFPMIDSASPASFKTGVSPVDDAYYKDGAGSWTSLAIADTASEIGSTGVYEIDLTAAELNHDLVLIKFTATGAAATAFLFNLNWPPTIIRGTVNTAILTPTTTLFAVENITEATADHYNGRVIIWTSGSLSGQATDITDYALVSGEGRFTVTAMTEAPADGDTFVIV